MEKFLIILWQDHESHMGLAFEYATFFTFLVHYGLHCGTEAKILKKLKCGTS